MGSHLTTTRFLVVSADDDEMASDNEGHRVTSKSPSLERAGEYEGAGILTTVD